MLMDVASSLLGGSKPPREVPASEASDYSRATSEALRLAQECGGAEVVMINGKWTARKAS